MPASDLSKIEVKSKDVDIERVSSSSFVYSIIIIKQSHLGVKVLKL